MLSIATGRRLAAATFQILSLLARGCPDAPPPPDVWTVEKIDSRGDGRDPSSLDAAQLSWRYDAASDVVWFRVALFGAPTAESFRVTIAVDSGAADTERMNWWGANNDFRFDRLITAWIARRGDTYAGRLGVADATGVRQQDLANIFTSDGRVRVDRDAIAVGVPRAHLGGGMKIRVVADVGSNQEWNDDIPDRGAAALDLSAPRPTRGLREIDVGRNNLRFDPLYATLADDRPPRITRAGHGRTALILIPGVYSGDDAFASFVARRQSRYRFFLVTPPGLGGTPARSLPAETVSYGEFSWTRRLEHDVLDLVQREHLRRPVIVAHGFPGSLVADLIASRQPGAIGGVIDVAAMPLQFFPSSRDPSRATPAGPDERVRIVDESWAGKWFKYVTPETWESNNYPAAMFANDADRAERARRQVEAAPLPVKIRYLTEFMASDHTRELAHLEVPLLALVPGFSEDVLSDPANGWFKTNFQESWRTFTNDRITVVTIPRARALMFDDQPRLVDDEIAAFMKRVAASAGS